MKIVIAGAGEMGSHLARMLSGNGHDITVIDGDQKLLSKVSSLADVITVEGDSTIFAGLFARLRSSLEDKIRFGQVQTTDARNIHRRHLHTLPCKEEEKEGNRKLSLTCRSPFTIFVEDRIRL